MQGERHANATAAPLSLLLAVQHDQYTVPASSIVVPVLPPMPSLYGLGDWRCQDENARRAPRRRLAAVGKETRRRSRSNEWRDSRGFVTAQQALPLCLGARPRGYRDVGVAQAFASEDFHVATRRTTSRGLNRGPEIRPVAFAVACPSEWRCSFAPLGPTPGAPPPAAETSDWAIVSRVASLEPARSAGFEPMTPWFVAAALVKPFCQICLTQRSVGLVFQYCAEKCRIVPQDPLLGKVT